MKVRGKLITEEQLSKMSFLRRLKYKVKDVVRPSFNPKTIFFTHLEKQFLFFAILVFVVFISVYLVIEFGY